MARAFTARERLEMWVMRCGGLTLAIATVIVSGDVRFAFKTAFDESFRNRGPGTHLIVEITNGSIDGRRRLLDSCADSSNELLNLLWPDRRALVSVALARPGARAGVLKRAIRATGTPAEEQTATG